LFINLSRSARASRTHFFDARLIWRLSGWKPEIPGWGTKEVVTPAEAPVSNHIGGLHLQTTLSAHFDAKGVFSGLANPPR
jgi:hypothetical protein